LSIILFKLLSAWFRRNEIMFAGRSSRPTTLAVNVDSSINQLIALVANVERNDDRKRFADKIEAKSVVGRAGIDLMPRTIAESAEMIRDWAKLGESRLIVKASHGSGAVILVGMNFEKRSSLANFEAVWPVSMAFGGVPMVGSVAYELVSLAQKQWLRYSYNIDGRFEWAYGGLKKRLVVEEFVQGSGADQLPDDLKIWCLGGDPFLVQVDSGRFGEHTRSFFDIEGNRLDASIKYPVGNETLPEKGLVDQSLQIAKTLASGTTLLRVDFLVCEERVVVGELTNYPGGAGEAVRGLERFDSRINDVMTAIKDTATLGKIGRLTRGD
jgi:hypothetical protein